MRLLFKQRFFSWFDSYDIYDEDGNAVYTVKGQLAWGHSLKIFNAHREEVGMVQEKIFRFLPTFEIYENDCLLGSISRDFTLFRPKYNIDFKDWQVKGSWTEWDYTITDRDGYEIAHVWKELLHMTDTYILDMQDPADALYVLMFVLAIDAEKCTRSSRT